MLFFMMHIACINHYALHISLCLIQRSEQVMCPPKSTKGGWLGFVDGSNKPGLLSRSSCSISTRRCDPHTVTETFPLPYRSLAAPYFISCENMQHILPTMISTNGDGGRGDSESVVSRNRVQSNTVCVLYILL